jgi:transcriptional regulator with XRE-family HTH domain
MAVSTEERDFFIELGACIASMRRVHNITQVQLAETLGVSRQTVQAYEVGRRRIPVSALPVVARILAVSLDELFGEAKRSINKRGPASQLQRSIERISELPKTKQKFVIEMLETVLAQANA